MQARAVDDFSVAIPAALLKEDAFLAIETAAAPWSKLPAAGAKNARSSGLNRAPSNK